MQIWQDDDVCSISENGGCCGLSAVEDKRRVANVLDIPHYFMNFRKEFKETVIDYFVSEYIIPEPQIHVLLVIDLLNGGLACQILIYRSFLYCYRTLCFYNKACKRQICYKKFSYSRKGSNICPV